MPISLAREEHVQVRVEFPTEETLELTNEFRIKQH